jgi:hypothetical protein
MHIRHVVNGIFLADVLKYIQRSLVTQNDSSSEPSTSNLQVLQVEGEKCRSYRTSTSPSGTGSEAAATKSCNTFDSAFRR